MHALKLFLHTMANNTSPHILNTAVNLLGFCLFVITSLHITNKAASTVLDEFTSIIALMLAFSSLLSFMSIKTGNLVKEKKYEAMADYLFIISLIGIVIIILLLVTKFVK